MYKCQQCGKQSKLGEKLNKKVVKTRNKHYTNYQVDERNKRIRDKDTGEYKIKESTGFEIVSELNVCGECDV